MQRFLMCLLWCLSVSVASGEVIISHEGATNPLDEGWYLMSGVPGAPDEDSWRIITMGYGRYGPAVDLTPDNFAGDWWLEFEMKYNAGALAESRCTIRSVTRVQLGRGMIRVPTSTSAARVIRSFQPTIHTVGTCMNSNGTTSIKSWVSTLMVCTSRLSLVTATTTRAVNRFSIGATILAAAKYRILNGGRSLLTMASQRFPSHAVGC